MTKKKNNIQKKVVEYANLKNKKAVIWTRVSTKEQAENNNSLEVQRKECEAYAKKHNIPIVKYYGGTYESAKKEGKLYRQMITEVGKDKDINIILVYSFDRFSRAGDEGILTKRYLKSKGVYVVSITQPTDPDSASGEFMENMLFLFNQFENNLRKGKCEAGMKECLENGYWYSRPPFGFDKTKEDKEHIIKVNATGELIRKAFNWKATEEISNIEIVKRLEMLDLKITTQKLSEIFHNPFYCGKIRHAFLEGKIIDGKQEVLIDEITFNRVNNLNRDVDYIHTEETSDTPLKRYVYCSKCGELLTGYTKVKDTGKIYHYYKCSTKGCCCNVSADNVHNHYTEFISDIFHIPTDLIPILKMVLVNIFNKRNQGQKELHKTFSKQLTECRNKINSLNIRYGLGEINSEVYNSTIAMLKDNETNIEEELEKSKENLSNLEKFIDKSLLIALKLGDLWKIGDFKLKQKLQNLLFPKGIFYNKEFGISRTLEMNKALVLFNRISIDYKNKTNKKGAEFSAPHWVVAEAGFEPTTFGL